MSTVIANITRLNDIFVPAGSVVALWDEVVRVMYGRPYSLTRIAEIPTASIARAKKKGYFSELYARRIHAATNGRLELISHGATKSSKRFQGTENRIIRSRSL